MPQNKSHAQLAKDLKSFVGDACPGVTVEVDHATRWQRTCFTFRWEGFAGLLLEERFRLVAKLIPPDYFERHCRGVVWLELTPDESVDDYLAQPRSEDVDDRLPEIWRQLADRSFFTALEDELVRVPFSRCPDDFTYTKRVMDAKKVSPDLRRDALLAFMRQTAYTDWEVLRKVRPLVEKQKESK